LNGTIYVLEAVHIEIHTLYMENIYNTLSVTKFVAYLKNVHIKAYLARRYVPRAWGPVKMTFIPVHRTANYTEAKGYHPVSLLSFMQKTMQKLVNRNIWSQSMGHVPYIYTNLPTIQETPHKLQCTM
jgi:hypothetical protein